MRIRGYINHGYRPPAPFVAVTASFDELNIEAKLPLLLDTGASSTIILWRDVERLEINTALIRRGDKEFTGLGGLTKAKPTPTTISFTSETGQLSEEKAKVFVISSPCPNRKLRLLPSILGRDVLNKCNLSYSPRINKVYLEK